MKLMWFWWLMLALGLLILLVGCGSWSTGSEYNRELNCIPTGCGEAWQCIIDEEAWCFDEENHADMCQHKENEALCDTCRLCPAE